MSNEINNRHSKRLVTRDFLLPFILVTSLFFLWGVAHSLLDVLNKHFQDILGITKARSGLVQSALYGGLGLSGSTLPELLLHVNNVPYNFCTWAERSWRNDKKSIINTGYDYCGRSHLSRDYGTHCRRVRDGNRVRGTAGLLCIYCMVCIFQGKKHFARVITFLPVR